MYYYIFEPPQGPKEYERTAQIKELLSSLGIAGEMAAPQPGRSTEDLVNLAIAKRYATIVAVGGMKLANQVARAMLAYDAVLGIVPTHDDPDIAQLIGTSDWKVASEQLKRRRWQHIQLGIMNTNLAFITPATVAIPEKGRFVAATPEMTLESHGPAQVTITPIRDTEVRQGLVLTIEERGRKTSPLASLFRSKPVVPTTSRFEIEVLTLQTSDAYPVTVAGEVLTNTPIQCTTEGRAIRLIVGKGQGAD